VARAATTIGLACALALACWGKPALAQANIGKAAAIKNDVQGVRGSATRALAVGGDVFSDDAVKTGDASLAQLLFLDQTTFTVAANSQAVLKDVYRPKEATHQLVMNAVTGAFRFVSGVQSPQHYQVQFPQGYLTVRGTIVDFLVSADRTIIILDEGAATVVPYATRVAHDLDRPGTALVVYNDGHVDGPMTADQTIKKINGSIPFPLFGNTIWPTQQPLEEADNRRDLLDFLEYGLSSGSQSRSGGSPIAPLPSDYRLKHAIVLLKHLDNGLNLYRYRYLWSDAEYVGVLAQEVEKTRPDAVVQGADGYLRVDYVRLNMQLLTWDQWRAANKD